MTDYTVSKVFNSDKRTQEKIDSLLQAEGIRRDKHLDYTCAIFDEEGNPIATGSTFSNSLRCFAVDQHYQGEGLLNKIISHLIDYQYEQGHFQLFIYTKTSSSKFFNDVGFHSIATVPDQVTFLENSSSRFNNYLQNFAQKHQEGSKIASIVMNANPFTLGHLSLVEKACQENDHVHLFVVSEDSSLFPFAIRFSLIQAGTAHLTNLTLHESGPYMISAATFPSYFQKDEEAVMKSHTLLDLTIFTKIAAVLGINRRYVGVEPTSVVTNLYNETMQKLLPDYGIEVVEIPRIETDGHVISASTVRKLIQEDNLEATRDYLPETTYNFLYTEAAQPIINKIKNSHNVVHH